MKLSSLLRGVVLMVAGVLLSAVVSANELGISLDELSERLSTDPSQLIFIDVRDPVEIMFVGFTDAVDANVPYLLVDRNEWDDSKDRFKMNRNEDFVAQIKAALAEKGLPDSALIVTMCRSGSERGMPSAKYLRDNGFEQARFLEHGFQGDAIKEGAQKGLRLVNGWQNAGKPWQKKPNGQKIFKP